jgi:cytochrome c5
LRTQTFSRPLLVLGSLALGSLGITVTAMTSLARAAEAPRPGADIYRDFCATCHSGGWQGAPIANEASEWSERMSAGADALLENVKKGLNAMPPMGTCVDCTDEELKSAIAEMLPAQQPPAAR